MSTTLSLTVNQPEHIRVYDRFQAGFSSTDATGGVALVAARSGYTGVVLDLLVSATGGANTIAITDGAGTLVPALNVPATTLVSLTAGPIKASVANSAITLTASAATGISVSYHYCYQTSS